MKNDQLIITDEIKNKWQNIVDIMAKLLNLPSGLIMRLVDTEIMVFLSSKTKNNPYKPGDKEYFENSGLYCETVIKKNKMLLVPNALSDNNWKNNPDIKLNMISYLGFPILLPDKTPFGTICVLDIQENNYSELYKNLVSNFRDTIETDIELLVKNQILSKINSKLNTIIAEKETILKETHHRIKNNIASIESLLKIHLRSDISPDAVVALQSAVGRVRSMRVLYDKLLLSSDYKEIPAKDYIESLIDTILVLFPSNLKISIDQQISEISLPSKKIFPLGVIINELLTNIIKYAFNERKSGLIRISLSKIQKEITLTITDNGKGLPKDFNISKSKGFGLKLIKMLAQQLNGNFSIDNHNGTRSILKFDI